MGVNRRDPFEDDCIPVECTLPKDGMGLLDCKFHKISKFKELWGWDIEEECNHPKAEEPMEKCPRRVEDEE